MARARKTDPQDALMAALALFWREGYGNVGTRQIEEETGITRFTLQTTYGGKMALYLQSLDAYLDMLETHLAPRAEATTVAHLVDWFEARLAPEVMPDMVPSGCMLINAAVEFHGNDADVGARTERFYDIFRDGFEAALRKVAEAGNLPHGPDPETGAELLLATMIALSVKIRAAKSIAAGRPTADAAIALLRSWAA